MTSTNNEIAAALPIHDDEKGKDEELGEQVSALTYSTAKQHERLATALNIDPGVEPWSWRAVQTLLIVLCVCCCKCLSLYPTYRR